MNKIIFFLLLAEFVFTLGAGLYGPIYAIFVQKIGGDILDAGIAWALFLITMATLEIPIGRLIDKHSKKLFLAAGYLIASAAIFGYIFVSNIWELFFLQIISGIAFALGDPAWDAWFSSVTPRKEKGFDWALYHASTGYGQGFAAIAGGALAQFIGFQLLFLAGGTIAIFSFFILLSIKEKKFMRGAKAKILHRHRIIKRRIHGK